MGVCNIPTGIWIAYSIFDFPIPRRVSCHWICRDIYCIYVSFLVSSLYSMISYHRISSGIQKLEASLFSSVPSDIMKAEAILIGFLLPMTLHPPSPRTQIDFLSLLFCICLFLPFPFLCLFCLLALF